MTKEKSTTKKIEIVDSLKDTMEERYYNKSLGEKTPQDMIRRVAKWVANGEKQFGWNEHEIAELERMYYETMNDRLWLPSSPFLMNAGTEFPMVFACFVVSGLDDNLPSIYETVARQGKINALGGGTGFFLGKLREEGAFIGSTGGTSSGVMSFADLLNQNGEIIKQGGRRRSANMGTLQYQHPEIMKFIKHKQDPNKLTNFNISVLADKEFFDLVEADGDVKLVSPKGNKVVGTMKARDIHEAICHGSWKQGDPAYLFVDNMNKNNPMRDYLGWIVTTNPCGEVILYPDEACVLASINLEEFVDWDGTVDWAKLRFVTKIATRFLDTSIDINHYPDEKIEKMVKSLRRLGLGIMSLHGALIKAGLKYSSQEGRDFAEELMKFVNDVAIEESEKLAMQKGEFPLWEHSSWAKEGAKKRRNVAVTTIAPTGTIQQILNTSSSGCEPIFAIVYRRLINGVESFWVNPMFKEHAIKHRYWTEELPSIISKNNGSLTGLDEVPLFAQELFEVAMDIHYTDHIYMQGALQKHVENSISKTINMKNDVTVEDIKKAYELGHRVGLKGMTVYRDGSRQNQVLSVGDGSTDGSEQDVMLQRGYIIPVPDETEGRTKKITTGCGNIYLTMDKDMEGNIIQTFVNRGSKGTCMSNQIAVSRLISLSLRGGISLNDVADQLLSIPTCSSYYGAKCSGKCVSKGSSCPSAIGLALKEYAGEKPLEALKPIVEPKIQKPVETSNHGEGKCPKCGETLKHEGGCISCVMCGFSKCD